MAVSCCNYHLVPGLSKRIVKGVVGMLVVVVYISRQEPQGYAFPGPPLGVSICRLVVGAELAGQRLLKIGFTYIIFGAADIPAIKCQGPVTDGYGVYPNFYNIFCRQAGKEGYWTPTIKPAGSVLGQPHGCRYGPPA